MDSDKRRLKRGTEEKMEADRYLSYRSNGEKLATMSQT
jgi:hypothetical protein